MDDNKELVVDREEIEIVIEEPILDLAEATAKVLEEKKKSPYSSGYSRYGSGYNSYSARSYGGYESDYQCVYFYEFSDLSRNPKYFATVSSFVKWAEENKILLSDSKKKELRTMPVSYSVCKEGSPTLITRSTKALLEQAMKNIANNGMDNDYGKASSVGVTNNNRDEGSYPYNDTDYYGNEYYDWD